MFITSDEYLKQFSKTIDAADKVDLAVAFLGAGAQNLFTDQTKPTRLLCNLMSGATNPGVIVDLQMLPQVEIKQMDNLHAKVLVTENQAILGSANLSTNGLNWEGKAGAGWHEAGYVVTDAEQIILLQAWFDSMWEGGRKILPADITAANAKWNARNQLAAQANKKSKKKRLLEMDDAELQANGAYLVLHRHDISPEAEEAADGQRSKLKIYLHDEQINQLDFYEDWEDLPEAATLLGFECDPTFALTQGKAWIRVSEYDAPYVHDGSTYRIQCVKLTKPSFLYGPADRKALAKKLAPVIERIWKEKPETSGGVYIRLCEALRMAESFESPQH